MDFTKIFTAINSSIVGATIIINCFLKKLLKGKKIKNFELTRLLPVCVLLISEVLCIIYGISIQEKLVISISNGVICAGISVLGYDAYKNIFTKGNKDSQE